VIAKRKGGRRESGSERSGEQRYEPMYKNRIRGIRAGRRRRSPYPSKALIVNSAIACGRRSNLAREICRRSWIQD
jgi:hypothetical protein